MDDSTAPKLNRAQQLELAGAVAPSLRQASAKVLARRVTLYDKDTGAVTGYAVGAEVLKGLAKIQELEHAVAEGVRPKEIVCRFCGRPIRVAPQARVPLACPEGCSRQCESSDCKQQVSPAHARKAAASGTAVLCRPCAVRRKYAEMTPEQKRKRAERISRTRLEKYGKQEASK